MPFAYNPVTGLLDTVAYQTTPVSETAARQQFMDLLYQARDYINNSAPSNTTTNLTYYVAPTGNDSNDGLTSGTPFLTITKAIGKIPQIVNHTVTINVSAGTYNENVIISGYAGKGSIALKGDTVASDNYKVNFLQISETSLSISVSGFKSLSTSQRGFYIRNAPAANLSYCKCSDTASFAGVEINRSLVIIVNCDFSNRSNGIFVNGASVVFSNTNTGSLNTVGLQSIEASTIGKNGTQPGGTTAESLASGGVIR